MHILITGGAGMLGQRLALALLKRGYLENIDSTEAEITQITLFDQHAPQPSLSHNSPVEIKTGDITNSETVHQLIADNIDVIFHLAAVVSGEAEQNFDLGMRVNLLATQNLLEACFH